jgi:hypothetical protein
MQTMITQSACIITCTQASGGGNPSTSNDYLLCQTNINIVIREQPYSKNWDHNCTDYSILQQNTAHCIQKQHCLSCIHDYRSLAKAHLAKAFTSRADATCIPSNLKAQAYPQQIRSSPCGHKSLPHLHWISCPSTRNSRTNGAPFD